MIKYRYIKEDGGYIDYPTIEMAPLEFQNALIEFEVIDDNDIISVPNSTTLAKFRMAFRRVTGVRIETIVDQIKLLPDSDSKFDMIDLLEYSNIIERNNQTLITGAGSFGVTLEQLDEIFITAENLNY